MIVSIFDSMLKTFSSEKAAQNINLIAELQLSGKDSLNLIF
jgi:hypothetical protein